MVPGGISYFKMYSVLLIVRLNKTVRFLSQWKYFPIYAFYIFLFDIIISRARDVKDSLLFNSFHMQRIFSTATAESAHGNFNLC